MSRFDRPVVRAVLLVLLVGLLGLAVWNALHPGAVKLPGSLAGKSGGRPGAPPGGPSASAAPQPQAAPAPERTAGDPLAWVTIAPLGAEQADAAPLLPETIVGNFDHDPDQECIVFSTGREDHWLCEADGSRRPLHLAGFKGRGCVAVDLDGDGVDDLVETPMLSGGGMGDAPAVNLSGHQVGSVHWMGSRFQGGVLAADFDGKPGNELLVVDQAGAVITSLQGKVLQDLNQLTASDQGYAHILPVAGDFDGDGRTDFFLLHDSSTDDPQSLQTNIVLEARNLAGKSVKSAPVVWPEYEFVQPACRDVNGDGCAEVIYSSGIIGIKSGWTPLQLPATKLGEEVSPGLKFMRVERVLAGDFERTGQVEIVELASEFADAGTGSKPPAKSSELWFFAPTGKLLRRMGGLPELQAADCFTLRAGGHDHLVLTYMDRVRISQ